MKNVPNFEVKALDEKQVGTVGNVLERRDLRIVPGLCDQKE